MAKKLVSNLKCVVVLEGVRIKPTDNPLITEEQITILKKNKDFQYLTKENKILIVDVDSVEEETTTVVEDKPVAEEKPLEEKTVAELKELAKSAGVAGVASMNKAELIDVLTDEN